MPRWLSHGLTPVEFKLNPPLVSRIAALAVDAGYILSWTERVKPYMPAVAVPRLGG